MSRRAALLSSLAIWLTACQAAAPATADLPDGPLAVDFTIPPGTATARVRLETTSGPGEAVLAATQVKLFAGGLSRSESRPGLLDGASYRLSRQDDRLVLGRDGEALAWLPVALAGEASLRLEPGEVTRLQPLEPPFASDDFARAPGDLGGWRAMTGDWDIAEYRDPLVAKYGLAAQASWLAGKAVDVPALALYGDDFWADYEVSIDVKGEDPAGLVFHAADAERYLLFRIVDGRARVLRVSPGGAAQVVADAPAEVERGAWRRLTVQASGEVYRAGVDGTWLFSGRAPTRLGGAVGVWTAGEAAFDDLRVEGLRLAIDDFAGGPSDEWIADGPWEPRGPDELASWTHAAPTTLRSRVAPFSRGEVSSIVRLPRDGEAGVRLAEPEVGCELTLRRRADELEWRLYEGVEVVDSGAVDGAEQPHALTLRRDGPALLAIVDGVRRATFYSGRGPTIAALTVRGPNGAIFGRAVVQSGGSRDEAELFRTDFGQLAMPGKLKNETWKVLGDLLRPKGKGWRHPKPDSDDGGQLLGEAGATPISLWYEAVPGDAGLELALNELSPGAALTLRLGQQGYGLRVDSSRAVLLDGDEIVGSRELTEPPATVKLWRDGIWLAAEVDGLPLAWAASTPRGAGPVGVELSGGRVRIGELAVTARGAVVSSFGTVDTSWRTAGEWRWNSGMACIAWSYWITADGREKPAFLWRRDPFEREVNLRVYASEYTDGFESEEHTHEHFPYHDLSLVLDGDGADPDSGYRFLIGAEGGRSTRLLREGQTVAENPKFTIRMGSHCNEPRTMKLDVRRSGGALTLWINGREAIAWTDPEPLQGGGLMALGVDGCRANFSDFVALRPALAGEG